MDCIAIAQCNKNASVNHIVIERLNSYVILQSRPIDAVNIKRTIRWIIIDVRDMEDPAQILIISLCDINHPARIFIIDLLNIKDTA